MQVQQQMWWSSNRAYDAYSARDIDEHHRLQWELAADEAGRQMMALFRAANGLRRKYPSLRRGQVTDACIWLALACVS